MHNQFKTQKFKHLMLAMGPRDLNSAPYSPIHCSSHSMTSFQSSELTQLPVVENSQLFAQRTVRPLSVAADQGGEGGTNAQQECWLAYTRGSVLGGNRLHRLWQGSRGKRFWEVR